LTSECPLGHEMADEDAFCSICGYERISDEVAPVDPESDTQRFDGASLWSTFCYVGAIATLLLGVVAIIEFSSIPRIGSIDRQEWVGMLTIIGITLFIITVLCSLGYLLDMVLVLVGRRAPAADNPSSAAP